MPSAYFTHAVSTETSDTTTHDYLIPSGNAAGKLLILIITHDGQLVSVGGLSGFTFFDQYDIGAGAGGADIEIWYKITDGTETNSTYTTTGSEKTVTHSLLVSDSDIDILFEVASHTENSVSSANPPNLAPSWGLKRNLWIVFIGGDVGDSSLWSTPDGYTLVDSSKTGTSPGDVATKLMYKGSYAVSEDPASITLDTTMNYRALTIGIHPNRILKVLVKRNP